MSIAPLLRRHPRHRPDLRVARALIFALGLALLGFGAWGLARARLQTAQIAGFGTVLVLGAVLVVFAALLPWVADGPVQLGPLSLTLRMRRRLSGWRSSRS
jgi:uncharacterized membrane protein